MEGGRERWIEGRERKRYDIDQAQLDGLILRDRLGLVILTEFEM